MTLAMAAGFASCSDNWTPGVADEGEGQVNLRSMGVDISNSEVTVSRAEIDLSPFIITITNSTGAEVARWTYASMPELFTLPVGSYTVTVMSHQVQKAAWSAPLYKGSANFQISDGQITDIGVVKCTFANMRVSILYSDELKEKLGDDVTVTVVVNDEGSLVYTPTETRSGYFEVLPGSTTMVATFHGTIQGESAPVTLEKTYADVQAGTHYKITFKLKTNSGDIPDEYGGITLDSGLVLDGDVETEDVNSDITLDEDVIEGDRPGEGTDDPPTGPDPSGPDDPAEDAITFTCATIDFTKANAIIDGTEYKVVIGAPAGVAHLVVNISSTDTAFIEQLPTVGVPTTFDLAYPKDQGEIDAFTSLGFPYGNDVIGKQEVVFNITDFVPLLAAFSGTHTFTLTATDANNITKSVNVIFLVP